MGFKISHMTGDPLYAQVFDKASHVDAKYDDADASVAFRTVAEGEGGL